MVVLPITKLQTSNDNDIVDLASGNEWQTTFPHELFHIISRNNPDLRNKLYKCIGYHLIPNDLNADLPNNLAHLKITNPDAPVIKHYIKLCTKDSEDNELCLAPILVASQPYSPDKYTSFFDYLLTKFAILDENWQVTSLISYSDVIGFYDKIGRNTTYIIHPEEILADNFVFLVTHETKVPSPNILQLMMDVLKE